MIVIQRTPSCKVVLGIGLRTGIGDDVVEGFVAEPNEVTEWFARETGRQLIITGGGRPIYLERLDRERSTS